MEVKAKHKNARITARKVRTLRPVLLGLSAVEAQAQLTWQSGKAADIILAVLQSAMANATNNFDIDQKDLIVADIIIDGGFTMKRHNPVSRGMAHPILKRNAHVTVVLEETGAGAKKPKVKKTADIQTITAEEHAASHNKEPSEPVADAPGAQIDPATGKLRASKQEQASQKTKMMQQGGEKTKTHRRKEI